MLTIQTGTVDHLTAATEKELAMFRHKIFVEKMRWPLIVKEQNHERDAFDHAHTTYVIARNASHAICGCARLLPTTEPYLLSEVFPYLMGDRPLPRAANVWELSRFAIVTDPEPGRHAADAWRNTCTLMSRTVATAASLGAQRIIAVSSLGNERLLKRMGVNVYRVAAPQLVDGQPVLAFWIEIDEQTRRALGLTSATAPSIETKMACLPILIDRAAGRAALRA